MKKILSLLLLIVALRAWAIDDVYTVVMNTNGLMLDGQFVPTTNLVGTINATNLPPVAIQSSNTNQFLLFTNTANGAWLLISTNGHFKYTDEYGTLYHFNTNGLSINWTNLNSFYVSNGSLYFTGVAAGNGSGLTNLAVTNIAGWSGISNTLATNWLATVTLNSNLTASNVMFLNTNFTAALNAWSNTFYTQLYTATSTVTMNWSNAVQGTNVLITLAWSNAWISLSNASFAYSLGLSNQVVTFSNAWLTSSNILSAYTRNSSNSLALFMTGLSNQVAPLNMKAFAFTLPATYASIGVAFNTPLMPDGNYSVSGRTPQDATTAGGDQDDGGFFYVDSKSASGFTYHAAYATNAFDRHYEIIVKENTQ